MAKEAIIANNTEMHIINPITKVVKFIFSLISTLSATVPTINPTTEEIVDHRAKSADLSSEFLFIFSLISLSHIFKSQSIPSLVYKLKTGSLHKSIKLSIARSLYSWGVSMFLFFMMSLNGFFAHLIRYLRLYSEKKS